MTKFVAAALAAVTLAQPAAAVTFPSLTTIYIGSGVYDSGGSQNVGAATVVNCSNVSGHIASVRFLVVTSLGFVASDLTVSLQHGRSKVVATHGTAAWFESELLGTGSLDSGAVLNIESTQSGVFCTAAIVSASSFPDNGSPLHLVRVNPHPGTVE